MRLDPVAQIRHFGLRLLDRRGVETGIEHVVNGVAIDGLFVLLPDLQDAPTERCLHEGRGGGSRQMRSDLGNLVFTRLPGSKPFLRGLDLSVGVAGIEQIVGKVRERLTARQVPQLGKLVRSELAL